MIYAIPHGGEEWLTDGKAYPVLSEDTCGGFRIRPDVAGEIFCLWEECAHANSWTRISIPEILQRHNVSPDCIAEVAHALHQIMGEVK